jgi:4-aminobutyrate aminotransferase
LKLTQLGLDAHIEIGDTAGADNRQFLDEWHGVSVLGGFAAGRSISRKRGKAQMQASAVRRGLQPADMLILAQEVIVKDPKERLSPIWSRYTEIEVDYAEGPYIYSTNGRRYLDFTTGIGVTNTGHCHPKVVAAAQAQVAKLIHGQANIVYHKPMLELVQELQAILPTHLDSYFFANSGAEAIEAAFKLARHATGRSNTVVFQGGFHGRTIGSVSLTTSNPIYHYRYQPLMAGVYVAPFPYTYFYGWTEEETTAFCLKQLRHLLASQTAPGETAAMLLEPVLGEGGYVVPPPDFLGGVQEICREHDILLIIDEVQSGFGRTGKWFGFQHFGIEPDIMVMAKGLASGFPLSGIATRTELMQKSPSGTQGGTYGGNAVSCAAAVATLRVMQEEGLIENSAKMGAKLIQALKTMQEQCPAIGEVRGLGLMVGIEFTLPTGEPDSKTAKAVMKQCLDDGLMLLTCGTYGNVVRWIPPLIIDDSHLEDALDIFNGALGSVVSA